ncbi:hypothetical protein KQX54_008410 [Cotesia glomerata]|uniref:Tc1-like transposase DDE domain-containing protein n=1 Tax=Cotesia glomerata TaxID=32391 RepID=A0AAV7IWW9_COTGL|nr:hypothetical protein KQX54_008410 [Cotesia glomerata]
MYQAARARFPLEEYPTITFMHDNSPVHTAAIVKEWFNQHPDVHLLPHPPYSPDLNPIENICSKFENSKVFGYRGWNYYAFSQLPNHYYCAKKFTKIKCPVILTKNGASIKVDEENHNHPKPEWNLKDTIRKELKRRAVEDLEPPNIILKNVMKRSNLLFLRKWNTLTLPAKEENEISDLSFILKLLPKEKVKKGIDFIQLKGDQLSEEYEDYKVYCKFIDKYRDDDGKLESFPNPEIYFLQVENDGKVEKFL